MKYDNIEQFLLVMQNLTTEQIQQSYTFMLGMKVANELNSKKDKSCLTKKDEKAPA